MIIMLGYMVSILLFATGSSEMTHRHYELISSEIFNTQLDELSSVEIDLSLAGNELNEASANLNNMDEILEGFSADGLKAVEALQLLLLEDFMRSTAESELSDSHRGSNETNECVTSLREEIKAMNRNFLSKVQTCFDEAKRKKAETLITRATREVTAAEKSVKEAKVSLRRCGLGFLTFWCAEAVLKRTQDALDSAKFAMLAVDNVNFLLNMDDIAHCVNGMSERVEHDDIKFRSRYQSCRKLSNDLTK